jgi:hypothetical protein
MRFIIYLIGILLLSNACKNNKQAPSAEAAISEAAISDQGETPSAEFMQFYEQFHADSIFQIEHISWPLPGELTTQKDSSRITKEPIEWQLDKWTMHRKINLSTGEFQRSWQFLGDLMVTERIIQIQSGFRLERRFAKASNGNWSLIFYSDI